MVKREPSQKAKLSIYWSIFDPTLTYGHKIWVVRLRIQAAEALDIGLLGSAKVESFTVKGVSSGGLDIGLGCLMVVSL